MVRHLAPVIIPETIGNPATPNAAFRVVEELVTAIKDSNVKNVAVSADYGAGKSSVVETAKAKIIKEEDIHWWRFRRKKRQTRFLTISLAQLNANGRYPKQRNASKESSGPQKIDKDKDIEYSLLQQLLYYDQPAKTPKSRFHRLSRIGIWRPLAWALCILLALVSCLILWEPESFRVPSFCEYFAVAPEKKFRIDCIAALILALLFVLFCIWLIRDARIKIGKVKVKDAEVEVNNLSVFNQYLDEIIYFFASTRYNVVIFEDLDRFADTTRIFGKLRELNKILNSSHYLKGIIKREITFVYSVRDDLFNATHRVKFFDYIVPVIPVVNSSNAYEKLSEYLDAEDKNAFDGKDLLNLCDYFEDLRLIINIVNEYDLYKKVIRLDDFKLSRKKLFGLIVYKNYCPNDFIHLHNRRGVLANILDNKKKIAEAIVMTRKQQKDLANEKLNNLKEESANWEINLRREYVKASKNQTGYVNYDFEGFQLQSGAHVSFERVCEEPAFFDELVSDKLSFYGNGGRIYSIFKFENWQKSVNNKPYQERLKQNPYLREIAIQKENVDRIELLKFSSADTFSTILSEGIKVLDDYLDKEPQKNRPFIPVERHQLVRFLLTHGFLDEHYLDYITYFYQNSIGIDDKRFILNITSLEEDSLPYTFHLQNPVSVADRFDIFDFKTNARLLNVDLVLSLTHEGDKQKANRNALQRLAMNSKAIDFALAIYEKQPSREVDVFLSELLAIWDFGALIQSLEDNADPRLPKLREINLRYSNLADPEMFNRGFQTWLNGHFGYLSSVFNTVGENRLREFLSVYKTQFSKVNFAGIPSSFANFIIDEQHYSINSSNIESIASFLEILDDYRRASFSTLYICTNQSLSNLIRQKPHEFIKVFPSSSIEETSWAKAVIAAENKIPSTTRKEYLQKQTTRIQDASDVRDYALDFVFMHSLVEPSWENIYYLCFEIQHAVPNKFILNNTLEGFLRLKPEQQNDIIGQWVFSNTLRFDVYERVVTTMYGFKKLESGVDERRIDVLVSSGLLLFNLGNYLDMRAYYPSLAGKFILLNLNTYLEDVRSYPVSADEMLGVLKSRNSSKKQAGYITSRPVFEGDVSADLADMLCLLIHKRHLEVDEIEEKMLLQSIKNSSMEEIRLSVARKALFGLPYSPERSKGILEAMGKEFSRICEPGFFSWMPSNSINNRIAKYLTQNTFIQSYEHHGNRIKIIKHEKGTE